MLPTGPTHKEEWMVEVVPAWKPCQTCIRYFDPETMDNPDECPDCHGEGGRWHEAVIKWTPSERIGFREPYIGEGIPVTKTSRLRRTWKVCSKCQGEKKDYPIRIDKNTGATVWGECEHCHGTGCEPDSQGPWTVVRREEEDG